MKDKELKYGDGERQEAKEVYKKSREAARSHAEFKRIQARIKGSKLEDFIDIDEWE
jgi:hypothetical protein